MSAGAVSTQRPQAQSASSHCVCALPAGSGKGKGDHLFPEDAFQGGTPFLLTGRGPELRPKTTPHC